MTKDPVDENNSGRIAVFTCMPPDTSGIATNSSKVFSDASRFDIFTYVASQEAKTKIENAAKLIAGRSVTVQSISAFQSMHEKSRYAGCVYVLGNSHHNLPVLRAAIGSRGMALRRSAYIHDCRLEYLWLTYCRRQTQRMIQLFSASYAMASPPLETQLELCRTHEDLLALGCYGIKPLALLSGIEDFIVNSDRAKRIVEQELAPDLSGQVHLAFHSIDRIAVTQPPPFQRNGPAELIIGHFGIPGLIKGTPIILAAAAVLRKTRPVRVVMAGWSAEAYCESEVAPQDREHIILVDGPSDEELFRYMKWVDVAVQLRERSFGESSGVVAQLIGVGRKPVATVNLIDGPMVGRTIPVQNTITADELAWIIANADTKASGNEGLDEFSSQSLGALIGRLVLGGNGRG